MIVVDPFAVIAILLGEETAPTLIRRLADDPAPIMSVANDVEAGTVLAGRRKSDPQRAVEDLDAFLTSAGIALAPVDAAQARIALEARVRFGRGMGHGGVLNFGDCFACALAKTEDADLLYVGDDFTRTDLRLPRAADR